VSCTPRGSRRHEFPGQSRLNVTRRGEALSWQFFADVARRSIERGDDPVIE
jgi:hypothetical protein